MNVDKIIHKHGIDMLTVGFKFLAEYVLHEFPMIVMMFVGGMMIDHYIEKFLQKYGVFEDRDKSYVIFLELILQGFLIAILVTFTRKFVRYLVTEQTIFSRKGRFVFDPKGRRSTQIMHAFILFFTQTNLKKKLKKLYDKTAKVLLK